MTKNEVGSFARSTFSLPIMVLLLLGSFVLLSFTLSRNQAYAAAPITPSGLNTQVADPIMVNGSTQYDITGGTRPGGGANLFHSFGDFSVPTNNIANFLNAGSVDLAGNPLATGLPTNNILGRVTAGNPSVIFGMIQTNGTGGFGNANLFLMNPTGFLFGPNATVNVGGMATFTTADYMRLRELDGSSPGIFRADPTQVSVLTSAPVAAFGFLGLNPAAIAVQGSQLTLANGTGLSLVGGNRGFTYTDPDTGSTASVPNGVTMTGGSLLAPSGQINIVGVASAGEISASDFMPTSGMTMGNIALSQGAVLDVSGDGGGTVRIRGGQFIMDHAAVIANTTGASDGATTAISVNVTDAVLLNNQSALVAQASNAGRGGDIDITGRTIDVAGTSFVYTASADSGSPGNITATASESISVRGTDQFGNPSEVLSDSLALASTGSIMLRSPLITLSEMGAVETRMFGFGAGARAGDIMIDTTNLNLISGGMIRTVSGSDIAPSGNISITAGETVNLIGTNDIFTPSNITNENTNGGTGNISIQSGTLTLSDQARINSQTLFDTDPAAANTPKIAITADSSITLSTGSRIDVGGFISDTGKLELTAQNLTMSGASVMTTFSNSSGASGPVVINVQNLGVSQGSQIVSSSGQGFGRGGDITVNATGSVVVTGQGTDPFGGTVASGIFSNTMAGFEDPSFTGNAGNISITGHSIEVSNGARIDSSSQFFALGNAGNIDLLAPTITVNDGTISTSTEFAGQAGTITLHADTVTLSNNGQLASRSNVRQTPLFDGEVIPLPSGNSGTIIIQGLASPAQSVLIDGAGIFTDTQGTGVGGNILVNANSVTLQNGGTLSAATSGTNNGGDIQVDATAINLLTFASINTLSFLSDGSAGNIALKATQQITAVDSFLNTDAVGGTGLGGNILLRAPTIGVNGGVLSTSTSGTGRAGSILLEGQQISLGASPLGGGQGADLFASTNFGSGHGGTIILRGLDGPSSQADVTISGNSRLQTLTGAGGSGNAGDITINAAQFTLTDHAKLNADTFGSGGAGTITITATDHATVSGLFTTVSSSSDFGATGNAGQISVSTPTVMIENGGSISTNTTGEGTGGNITILAGQSVTMTNGSSISASSTGPGNAGNILINAGNQFAMTNSSVTTEANQASGGAIKITTTTSGTVELTDSTISASVLDGTGGGGSVNIDPQFVILQNSQILAQAKQGPGGNISITTNLLLPDANSVISASSEFGVNGTVTIQSPNAPGSGQVQPLGKTPLQATSLLNQHCAALAGGEFSSFTVAGRDSLPVEPGSWLASPLATLHAGMELGVKTEGVRPVVQGEGQEGETALLSLRQIAPAGFLTQAFAGDRLAGCTS